ncbi:MAG: hypothetical protein IJE22_00005, partial [Oscillibacter sp.]|nr:hypothetical protein [Oscillibacter sp.]
MSKGEGIYSMGISHIYNGSVTSQEVYGDIKTYIGIGFKLNVQQYLMPTESEEYPYVYLDAAGRQHSIACSNGVYYDTSGLGLIMIEEGSRRILTDVVGNRLVFNSYG